MSGTQFRVPVGLTPILLGAAVLPWLLLSLPLTGWFGQLLPYDQHRVVQLGALVFAGLLVTVSARSWLLGAGALGMRWSVLIVFSMSVGLLSASQSARPMLAFQEVAVWGLIVCCCLTVAGWCAVDRGSDQVLSFVVAVSALAHVLSFFVGYFGALWFGPPVLDTHMIPGYGNYRVFNHYQTWLFPIVLSLWRWAPYRPSWRIGAGLLSALWFSMAYVTGARATLLAVAVTTAMALFAFREHALPLVRSALVGALIGAAFWAISFLALPLVIWGVPVEGSELIRSDLSLRNVLWSQAANLMWQSPWLGVGPMHFAYFPNPVASGPHNFSLQLAAEWGLPVAVLVCAGIGLALVRSAVSIRRQLDGPGSAEWLDVVLWVSLLAGAIDAQLSDSMNMPMSQIWMLLVVGWALGRSFRAQTENAAARIRFRGLGIAGRFVPAALAVLVIEIIWPTPTKLHEFYVKDRICCLAEIPKHRHFSYRFWRQGWILSGTWSDSERPDSRETRDRRAPQTKRN